MGQLNPNDPTERILNGPTNEAWIDPWTAYLDSLGVDLHAATPATDISFDGTRVTSITVGDGREVTADEFVLAVPVEVAPRFVTAAMARRAPSLARVDRLDTAWMNGIQFYLSEDVRLSKGHQVYADSPWALTSISQRQFWSGYDVDSRGSDEVSGVLSVIASDWETPGIVYDKPARACTRTEIVEEIWAQLQTHLNGEERILSDEMRVDYFLDPALVETETGVENLTLASDYVRTNSDLASMESANEAGRRAANAICKRHGVRTEATVWDLEEPPVFEPFKRQDRLRYRLGLSHPAELTQSLRSVRDRLTGTA